MKIYSDGGARGNPGPAAVGILVCDEAGRALCEHSETIGDTTNNVAEYTAVIVALDLAARYGRGDVDYFLDSELVAKQMSGLYKIKTPHIKTLADQANLKRKQFTKVTFHHVPRTHEKIRRVDRLLNQALDAAGF